MLLLCCKLIKEQEVSENQHFYLFKILRAHILPLTNCAFNKSGDRFITGSYDRTCKVWNTNTGEELLTLEGHKNVVYAIAFNNPFGDKIITGSFDKTCKIWNSQTGELIHTLRGHATEIVCLSFNPQGDIVATGSMDNTAKLWDVDTGTELCTLLGHTAEIVSLCFNQTGDMLITGSFDHTTKLWDVKTGRCIHSFAGHKGEISSCSFDWSGERCITGSIDRTCKIWNVKTGACINTLRGHNDEILDVCFNSTGTKLVTASADGTARVYNTMTGACISILVGHEGEISKVPPSPRPKRSALSVPIFVTPSSYNLCRCSLIRRATASLQHPATRRVACGVLILENVFRFSKATSTRFFRARSIMRATLSSPAARITRAESGNANALPLFATPPLIVSRPPCSATSKKKLVVDKFMTSNKNMKSRFSNFKSHAFTYA